MQQLGPDSFLVPTLRKPDFQRETNHWNGDQVVTFLKSFLDNELVPSVIFWRSPGKIFVIDGAHRLSALLAWINDDYGDGHISKAFYGNKISNEQQAAAESLRKKINREIGSFKAFYDLMRNSKSAGEDEVQLQRADNARVRNLDLQWVEGDAEKAESSFFKINKQGTALDKTEERLLRLRNFPIAIASRSVVRAGAGHKYWSKFNEPYRNEIEVLSKELHGLLFSPELQFPIKTLNLPHGGKSSPISAYNLLMDTFSYAITGAEKTEEKSYLYQEDVDGSGTVKALKDLTKVMKRITGNGIESLGLHPAVYFYSQTGKHWDMIFISLVNVISKALRDNNNIFFKKFKERRKTIEAIFLKNKSLISQANVLIHSKHRIERWSKLLDGAVNGTAFINGATQEEILSILGVAGKIVAGSEVDAGDAFSDNVKSAAYLAKSLEAAHLCPLCEGYVQAEKSVSYDHINAKANGGKGGLDNIQLTHPYCNSLKGSA